jgi:hypothetical protein
MSDQPTAVASAAAAAAADANPRQSDATDPLKGLPDCKLVSQQHTSVGVGSSLGALQFTCTLHRRGRSAQPNSSAQVGHVADTTPCAMCPSNIQRVWQCSSFCGRPCIIKESCSRPYRHEHFKRKQPAGSRLKQVWLCLDGAQYPALQQQRSIHCGRLLQQWQRRGIVFCRHDESDRALLIEG